MAFVGVGTLAGGGYIRMLKRRRFLHVTGWRKVKGRFSTPLYSLGDKPDVLRPRIDDTNREAPGMERIVAVLEYCGGLTYREIAAYTGLSPNTAKNSGYLDALLVQHRIHIVGWKRSRNGPMTGVYVAGRGRNAARPDVLTSTARSARHRARRAAETGTTTLTLQLASLCDVKQ